MKEVEALIQRAKKAIASAELLLKEGDFDSSISRSYYAMFYATEALLRRIHPGDERLSGERRVFEMKELVANIMPQALKLTVP